MSCHVFDRCADGMLPGEHGHFSPSLVLILLIDCQGRLDSGEGPAVEGNPVARATNATLERVLRFQQLAAVKVRSWTRFCLSSASLGPQIFRTAARQFRW